MSDLLVEFAQIRYDLENHVGPDMCKCSNCGWQGDRMDCESEWESEGWEYPDYQVDLCPVCPDGGCIDDYWMSSSQYEITEIVDIIKDA